MTGVASIEALVANIFDYRRFGAMKKRHFIALACSLSQVHLFEMIVRVQRIVFYSFNLFYLLFCFFVPIHEYRI